jgi:hypothetical protein
MGRIGGDSAAADSGATTVGKSALFAVFPPLVSTTATASVTLDHVTLALPTGSHVVGLSGSAAVAAFTSGNSAITSGITYAFSSSNAGVASVNASSGLISYNASGSAFIAVTGTQSGSGLTASTSSSLSVSTASAPAVLSSVTLTLPTGAVSGSSGTATAQGKDQFASNYSTGVTYSFASLNTGIATVNASTGLISYVGVGTGSIAVAASSASVTVSATGSLAVAAVVVTPTGSNSMVSFSGLNAGAVSATSIADVASRSAFAVRGRVSAQALLGMTGSAGIERALVSISDVDAGYLKGTLGIHAVDGDGTTYFRLDASAGVATRYSTNGLFTGTPVQLNNAVFAGLTGSEMLDFYFHIDNADASPVFGAVYRADGSLLLTTSDATATAISTDAGSGIVHVASGFDIGATTAIPGAFDYVAVSTGAVSGAARHTKPAPTDSGVLHLWDFNESSGSTALDGVTGGTSLTLSGFTRS